jgi:uncharacterized protein (TIGR02996 family)
MTHHDGFLTAILAEPEEDSHRLVFADWLDENGDPDRAAFIRVQCELAALGRVRLPDGSWGVRTGCPEDDARERVLRRRERELVRANGPVWVKALFAGDGFDRRCVFRRGFLAEVTLPCGQWMRHGLALVRAAPLERVTLSNLHPSPRPPWHDWYPPWTHDMALAHHDVPAAILPEPLWNALDWPTEDGKGSHGPAMRGYPSEDAALDALSRASLKWARRPSRATH